MQLHPMADCLGSENAGLLSGGDGTPPWSVSVALEPFSRSGGSPKTPENWCDGHPGRKTFGRKQLDRRLKWYGCVWAGVKPEHFDAVCFTIPDGWLWCMHRGGGRTVTRWQLQTAIHVPDTSGNTLNYAAKAIQGHAGNCLNDTSFECDSGVLCQDCLSASRQPEIAGKDRVMRAFAKLISRQGSRELKQRNPRKG